jgi:tetratricopeptide (TPR) repeat protein
MPWEALGIDGLWPKVLAIVATFVTICSGGISIVVWIKTWHRRRLKLLKDYLADREEDASVRRPHVLAKIESSLYAAPPPDEPNVSKHVEDAIALLDLHKVTRAQSTLEDLQEQITKKIDFVQRYGEELRRHRANVSLFLAAIADRRNDPRQGLNHIADAKRELGSDVDVLKYEGLLQLKDGNWTGARDTFKRLEDEAIGNETRHYKALGAKGRGDALRELRNRDDAIDAYDLALKRIGEAEPQHRSPVFAGIVHLRLAELRERAGDVAAAHVNASRALEAFGTGLGVRTEDLKLAEEIKSRTKPPMTNTPTN